MPDTPMTSHELARKLLKLPDLPVYLVHRANGHAGECMPLMTDDPPELRHIDAFEVDMPDDKHPANAVVI